MPVSRPGCHIYTRSAGYTLFSSVQSSRSVVSESLRPHGLQHTRLPCPSPTLGACSNSCPLTRWCHSTISSSVVPFSCLQSFLVSGSFPMTQFFASGGQSTGVGAIAFSRESWALKNQCFWTVVLEKTLESLLDCKEIKQVNPKGNQSGIFT